MFLTLVSASKKIQSKGFSIFVPLTYSWDLKMLRIQRAFGGM